MKGYPDGNFGPQKPITRAEALVCLDRALNTNCPFLKERPVSRVRNQGRAGVEDVEVTVLRPVKVKMSPGLPLTIRASSSWNCPRGPMT